MNFHLFELVNGSFVGFWTGSVLIIPVHKLLLWTVCGVCVRMCLLEVGRCRISGFEPISAHWES